jgi:LPS O-antigen subunit length determinant protein (WzzB/FepE family)
MSSNLENPVLAERNRNIRMSWMVKRRKVQDERNGVAVAAYAVETAKATLTEAVVIARRAGVSWPEIAKAAAVDRQTAIARWSRLAIWPDGKVG